MLIPVTRLVGLSHLTRVAYDDGSSSIPLLFAISERSMYHDFDDYDQSSSGLVWAVGPRATRLAKRASMPFVQYQSETTPQRN